MKKYLLIFLLACSAAWTAQAQTTFNVRAGVGAGTYYCADYYYGEYTYPEGMGVSPSIVLQANIGLNRRGTFTFSPTFIYSVVVDEWTTHIGAFPLFFGYKIPVKQGLIFFPKIGPVFGVIGLETAQPIAGPAIELAIEKNHFVTAIDYYYSGLGEGHHQLAFTVGYKF